MHATIGERLEAMLHDDRRYTRLPIEPGRTPCRLSAAPQPKPQPRPQPTRPDVRDAYPLAAAFVALVELYKAAVWMMTDPNEEQSSWDAFEAAYDAARAVMGPVDQR